MHKQTDAKIHADPQTRRDPPESCWRSMRSKSAQNTNTNSDTDTHRYMHRHIHAEMHSHSKIKRDSPVSCWGSIRSKIEPRPCTILSRSEPSRESMLPYIWFM